MIEIMLAVLVALAFIVLSVQGKRIDELEAERIWKVSRLTERFDLMNHHQRWFEEFEQRLVRLEQLTKQGGTEND